MLLSIGLVLVARPTPLAFWIGMPLVVAGELLRVWSAGYLTKLSCLVTAGPFAMCRNPLYVGSFLICLGYLIMCQRLDAFIIGIILFWILHGAAVAYEERLLTEKFGDDFKVYCKVVPRFIPRIGSGGGQGSFSFGQVMANDEYRGAAAAALFLVIYGYMAYDSSTLWGWISRLGS
ncbi:MAG: methyltransferase family protein [Armatimonadota bacterium]|jgi:protein-S-isoprenylcysteine O-methyltransferase Ste14